MHSLFTKLDAGIYLSHKMSMTETKNNTVTTTNTANKASPKSGSLPYTSLKGVLLLALAFELGLLLIGMGFQYVFMIQVHYPLDFRSPLWGAIGFLGLLLAMRLIFCDRNRKLRILKQSFFFLDSVVTTLANNLSLGEIILLSTSAAICEEYFFRGILDPLITPFFSNLLCAYAHLGMAIFSFPLVGVLYFATGFLMSFLTQVSGGLTAPIIAHLLYDIAILSHLRRKARLYNSRQNEFPQYMLDQNDSTQKRHDDSLLLQIEVENFRGNSNAHRPDGIRRFSNEQTSDQEDNKKDISGH